MADVGGRDPRRASGRRRQVIEGSTLGAAVILGAVLLGMVNYLGGKYYQRFDWTSTGLYTLSEKTENLLGSLQQDIEFIVFLSPDDELYGPVRELLSRYRAASSRVSVREVDPVRNLAEAERLVEQHQIDRQNVVVVAAGDDRRVLPAADLSEVDFSGERAKVSGFRGEQAFSNAILELTEAAKPTIVFTTAHGERALDDLGDEGLSQLESQLGRDNFTLDTWNSATAPAVPAGTDLVVIAGPQTPFLEPELAALADYLAGGGRILLMLDPRPVADRPPVGFSDWLAGYGISAVNDIVVDPQGRIPFYSDETFQAMSFADHPITQAFEQARIPVIFSLARSLEAGEPAAGQELTVLIRTSPDGWGERDLDRLPEVAYNEGDAEGPVALAIALQGEKARMVVFGNSTLAANRLLRNAGNAALVNNVVNWLVQREQLLGIPAKEPEHVRLELSAAQTTRLYLLVLLGLPGAAVVAGILMHRRRRR